MTDKDMERVAAPHDTKAAKIRALNEAGASTSAISAFLEVRYQHTYNVLLRAGRLGRSEKKKAAPTSFFIARLQADGGIMLPEELVAVLGANSGDDLVCREAEGGILVMTREAASAELQRQAAERMPEHAALLSALLVKQPAGSSSERGG